MNEMSDGLLAADELAPVTVRNENGPSPLLIVANHAGNSIPRALGHDRPPQKWSDLKYVFPDAVISIPLVQKIRQAMGDLTWLL